MSLIDETYFQQGELKIPNTNDEDVLNNLEHFITKYEGKFLRDLLGYPLYKAFTDALKVTPVLAKWTALKSGADYTVNGITYRWDGLIQAETSMIANYVYYYWQKDNVTVSTGTGEKRNKSENSTDASPAQKVMRAWSEMVEQCWHLVRFIESNPTVYPEWDRSNIYTFGTSGWGIKDIFQKLSYL